MRIRLLMLVVLALFFQPIPGRTADEKTGKDFQPLFKPLKVEAGDEELHRLLKERFNEAVAELHGRTKEFLAGRGTLDYLYDAHRRVIHSGLEIYTSPADRISFLQKSLDQAKEVEKTNRARFDAGRIPSQDMHRARYFRLSAEIELLRARRAAEKK